MKTPFGFLGLVLTACLALADASVLVPSPAGSVGNPADTASTYPFLLQQSGQPGGQQTPCSTCESSTELVRLTCFSRLLMPRILRRTKSRASMRRQLELRPQQAAIVLDCSRCSTLVQSPNRVRPCCSCSAEFRSSRLSAGPKDDAGTKAEGFGTGPFIRNCFVDCGWPTAPAETRGLSMAWSKAGDAKHLRRYCSGNQARFTFKPHSGAWSTVDAWRDGGYGSAQTPPYRGAELYCISISQNRRSSQRFYGARL